MKKLWLCVIAVCLLLGTVPAAAEEGSGQKEAAERGRAALLATEHSMLLQFPEEEDYLPVWKTLYARRAFQAPCLAVKSVPDMYDADSPNMPYLYEGTEVTVVAEHGDMSCILYDGHNFKHYCGWIKSIRLLEKFPGEFLTVGTVREDGFSVRTDVQTHWENAGYLNFWSSAFSEEVKDCVGFLLEYQLIAENVDVDSYWYAVYGPRKIYVNDGKKWVEAGAFAYPEAGAVHVQVWLDEPMTVKAVGTVPQCLEPDLPEHRQTVKEFYISDGASG